MPREIVYHYSLNSPWTYLGDARFAEIAASHGATVVHKPTNYRIVFPETGGLPLPKRPPARQAYRKQELHRWRDYLGLPMIPFPKHHPADERHGVGMVLAAINAGQDPSALVNGILSALWEDDLDTGDPDILLAVAARSGYDGPALLEAGAADAIAEQWERNSQEALASGVFGAPTYILGDQLFWGQDRLDFLERALAAG